MMRPILIFISLILVTMPVCAQTAGAPNEGSRLSYDGATQTYRYSWWGRAGKRYFIKHSDDLMIWSYFPYIILGQEAAPEIFFQTNSSRYFLRLEIEDDPLNTDSDGDLIPDEWELMTGTNRLVDNSADDPDEDGMGRTLEHLAGRNPAVADSPVDASNRMLDVHSSFGL